MKKLYALIIISAMAVSITACGGSKETSESTSKAESATVETSAESGAETVAEGSVSDVDLSAFYGQWFNMDTSLAEIELTETTISLRGDVYEITEVTTSEETNSDASKTCTCWTLYTEEIGDGKCYEAILYDETGTEAEYKSLLLYEVTKDSDATDLLIGTYANDIQFTNGELASQVAGEADAEGFSADISSAISTDAKLYLLKEVELANGKTQSKDDFSSDEFALIYDETSPCLNGMMFSKDSVDLFRIMSENGVIKLEVGMETTGGETEMVLAPMTFDEAAGTMTLDFSDADTTVKKMTFELSDQAEFFSGNREQLKALF